MPGSQVGLARTTSRQTRMAIAAMTKRASAIPEAVSSPRVAPTARALW